jgi:DNA-binding transcriptional LysR family regulator
LTDGDRFASGIANLKRGGFGALAIGAIMATAPDLLPKATAERKRRRPLMTIQVMAATSERLTDVAVLPKQIIAPEIERGEFVQLPIRIEGPLEPYGIVKRRAEALAPNASEFVAVIRELSA